MVACIVYTNKVSNKWRNNKDTCISYFQYFKYSRYRKLLKEKQSSATEMF